MAGLLAPQRNSTAEEPEFERIAADGPAGKLDLRTLNQPERHQALDLGAIRIHGVNHGTITGAKRLEGFEGVTHAMK